MKTILVPRKEDSLFKSEFKKYLLHQVNNLYVEYKEIPDEIVFKGKLGAILYNLLKLDDWKLGKTKMIHEKGSNEIIIHFTRNITIKKDSLIPTRSESLDGKIVNGIIDSKSASSINKASNSFSIEKTVSPSIRILLKEMK